MRDYSNKEFVHFHCHSEFSNFDGLAKIEDLTLEARKMGFPALALTDHGNVMGWIKFLHNCKTTKTKKGKDIPYPPIKAILGSEFYLSRKMDTEGDEINVKKIAENRKQIQPEGRRGNRHLNLYAMNWKGYQNICKLSQASFVKGFYFDPRIDIEMLNECSDGVMGGSACLSNLININLVYNRYDVAKKIAGLLNEILRGNFFLEIMYHGIMEEKEIIPYILKLSSELNIPVLASNDCHYLKKEHGESQEVFMCLSQGKCIKDPKRLRFKHKEFYLKSAQEMAQIFENIPNALSNTVLMSERINTDDIEKNLFGGMRLPHFDIPQEYKDPYDYLSKIAWDGLIDLGLNNSQKHVDRLKMELGDVKVAKDSNNYDFSTYFLIVRDYIKEAERRGIFVGAGRGSGYASLLLKCIGVTYGDDPLRQGLLWERFLGFDNKKFIKESDFGFKDDKLNIISEIEIDDSEEDEIEDLGGINRY